MLSKVSAAGTVYAQACAEKTKKYDMKRSSSGEYFRQLFKRVAEYDFERMFTRIVRQQFQEQLKSRHLRKLIHCSMHNTCLAVRDVSLLYRSRNFLEICKV